MAMASMALSLISAGMSAYSMIQQGEAQRDAYEYSAAVNDANAVTASIETAQNELVARQQARQRLSRQLVAQGEAGISGSSFATTSYLQSVQSSESDILNLRYKGLAELENYKNASALNRFSAKDAIASSRLGAYTQLVGGAADALSKGYSYGLFTKRKATA